MIGNTVGGVDSAGYLPAAIAQRYGVITVPMLVVVDDAPLRELVDIDAAGLFEKLAQGAKVTTSQPPPGAFLEAYEAAARRGAEQVLSVHIGSRVSGAVESARIAAGMAPVPVRVVDTGQASFPEGLCAWEALEALEAGASPEEAEAEAVSAGRAVGNVFIVRGLELLKRGGRMAAGEEAAGVPLLALVDGAVKPIGSASSVEEAIEGMVGHLQAAIAASPGKRFRVGIAVGAAGEIARRLEQRVRGLGGALEVHPYQVGPVVATHTGPGTAGIVYLARPVR